MSNLKLAFRSLFREPGVTIVALLFFALGIAANSTIFSLVQAVAFPQLIYPDASRIVFLESRDTTRSLEGMLVSSLDATDIAGASRALVSPSLTADQSSILREVEPARRVGGRRVTHTFFEVMRVPPLHGRTLSASDGPGALVMSAGLWRTSFAADPDVVGRAIRLDGGTVTVVGVMPDRFDEDADFWTAWPGENAGSPRDDRQYMFFARLAPGVSLESATKELADISARLSSDHPATNTGWVNYPVSLTRLHGRSSQGSFLLLQGAVAFVLLIACANISNLLLARGTRRSHEMAVRLSLGATRRRLLSQLLTESVLLALAGGAIGAVLTLWGIRLARAVGGYPEVIEPSVNVYVLLFTAAVAMLTGIVSGIFPAVRMSRVSPDAVLRAEGNRGATRSGAGLRTALVAIQIASAIALATGGALMIQTMAHRLNVDLGFNPRGAIRADFSLTGERFTTPEAAVAAVEDILESLRTRNEVHSAGLVTWALPTSAGARRTFSSPSHGTTASPAVQAVTPGYFEAMEVPLRSGRAFAWSDRTGSMPVAVVNDDLAQKLWPSKSAVGEFLRLGGLDEAAPIVTVVGVVGNVRRSAMHDTPVPRVYVPFAQHPNVNATRQVIIRGRQGTDQLAMALSRSLRETDASLFAEGVRTLEDDVAQFVAPTRLVTLLLAGFAATGMLLAALGVFGTMTYNVSQRARELAIRSALGASRREMTRMVLRSALIVTVAGIVPGTIIALVSSRALASELYGVSAADPWTLAGVVGVVLVVSIAASYRPAAKAASADPMTVLRQD